MRVLAGTLLALMTTGPQLAASGNLAVTLNAQPQPRSCAVLSTATIVAYDALRSREVVYRFLRSDGSVSRTERLAFAGDGAVAQSVRDRWAPRGAAPWVALEIVAPEHVRSQRIPVAQRCSRGQLAASR
jgi:hypothetical protein